MGLIVLVIVIRGGDEAFGNANRYRVARTVDKPTPCASLGPSIHTVVVSAVNAMTMIRAGTAWLLESELILLNIDQRHVIPRPAIERSSGATLLNASPLLKEKRDIGLE